MKERVGGRQRSTLFLALFSCRERHLLAGKYFLSNKHWKDRRQSDQCFLFLVVVATFGESHWSALKSNPGKINSRL